MELTVASLTDVGRVRTNNEDSYLTDTRLGLFIVCDGMGGHNAGEVASRLCCDWVAQQLREAPKWRQAYSTSGSQTALQQMADAMHAAVSSACREICRQGSRTGAHAGMGTTCTALLVAGRNKAILGHVGDSRPYLLRQGIAHQLSTDHTYVNELVKRGAITAEQALHHPQGNVLSRAMGVTPEVRVDTLIFDLDAQDTLFLCSDGVHHYYDAPQEIATLANQPDLGSGLQQLLGRALERGGHDNCTGILARLSGNSDLDPSLSARHRLALLAHTPLFANLTYVERVQVAGLMQLGFLPDDQWLCRAGIVGDELYLLLSGEVEVSDEAQGAQRVRPGALLGELAVLEAVPRRASVRTRGACYVASLQREPFLQLIRREPVLGSKILSSAMHWLGSQG